MSSEREDLLSYLNKTRRDLVDLAQSLTVTELDLPTGNPGWSVKDTLAHTVSSEAGLMGMALRAARGDEAPRPTVDLNTRNQQNIDARRDRSISDLVTELAASRQKLMEELAGLSDQQLAAPASFPPGRSNTVSGILRVIGSHEESHGAEIRQALGR